MPYLDVIMSEQSLLLRGLASGRIRLPFGGMDIQPFDYFGFPPALIPLWYREGPSYFGIWRHWFCDRKVSLVKLSPENGYRVSEWACTPEQLVRVLVLQAICAHDEISDDIRAFAHQCNIEDPELNQLDQITMSSGDNAYGLLVLPHFQTSAPAICFPGGAGYTGEFPTEIIAGEKLSKICSLEIPAAAQKTYVDLAEAPPWLQVGPKAKLFDDFLSEGRLCEAWLTLNSSCWSFQECRMALVNLARAAGNEDFSQIVDCWLALNHEDAGAY